MNPQGMEEHKHARPEAARALAPARALARGGAALADRVVATDEATRADVPRLLGVAADKVVVLPNGIDPEEIARLTPGRPARVARRRVPGAARRAAPSSSRSGRLEAYKGFDDVLAALARLHARGALPARLGLGGGRRRAAGASALRARPAPLARARAPGRAAWASALLHALYARADVFVHATRFEGSSLVTLEAMAHGAAGGGHARGRHPRQGRGRRDGPPGGAGRRARRWPRRSRRCAPDRGARGAWASAGGERARERFAWPALVERTLALYEELLRRGARDDARRAASSAAARGRWPRRCWSWS